MINLNKYIRISGIVNESIVDGPGIRLAVFSQGCRHNCLECHNLETHSFQGGYLIAIDEIIELIKKNPLLDGVTFSGGDPFEQAELFGILGEKVHELGLNTVTYTGYTYEEILSGLEHNKGWSTLLYNTDILIDGKFDKNKRKPDLRFRGSTNQRVIDVKKTLDLNRVVEIY